MTTHDSPPPPPPPPPSPPPPPPPPGRIDEARRKTQENPFDARAHRELGAALHDGGHLLLAMDALRTAVTLAPDDPMAHQDLALVYSAMKEWYLATEHHLRAMLLGTDGREALFELGWAGLHEGDLFFHTAGAYELITEIGRNLVDRHIRNGKLEI